jgi:hypothetical protein
MVFTRQCKAKCVFYQKVLSSAEHITRVIRSGTAGCVGVLSATSVMNCVNLRTVDRSWITCRQSRSKAVSRSHRLQVKASVHARWCLDVRCESSNRTCFDSGSPVAVIWVQNVAQFTDPSGHIFCCTASEHVTCCCCLGCPAAGGGAAAGPGAALSLQVWLQSRSHGAPAGVGCNSWQPGRPHSSKHTPI